MSIAELSYKERMDQKIEAFSHIPLVRRVLAEKVDQVAAEKLRDQETPVASAVVEQDFQAAMAEFEKVEQHVFHIQAPPSLTLATLQSHQALSLNQSVILHSVRSASEVLQMARAFRVRDSIRNIVPLSTERLVMHNLTRRFVLNYSLQGELSTELVKIIKPLTQRILREQFNKTQRIRDSIEERVLEYLGTGNADGLNGDLIRTVDELMKQATGEDSGLTESDIQEVVAKRTADLFVETYVKQVVDQYDLDAAPELAGYKKLPPQTKETRRIFMINGGIASGKSSAQALEAQRAKDQGVEWEDICPINRDAFKPMLLKAAEVKGPFSQFFASFTEDEAYLLRDAILREYRERLVADTAPHLYIDQVSPTIDTMRMAAKPGSRGLDLTIVYTPVEASLLMAHGREKATGYGAVTQGVLNTHAGVPKQLLKSIEMAKQEGCTNIRLRIVANAAPGVVVPVALIDFSDRKGTISDRDRLLLFFHKSHIRPDAQRFRDLYPPLPSPEQCCTASVMELTDGIEVTG